jgi:ABC-type transport system involved in multi-copper enzyme maturation permease subunit
MIWIIAKKELVESFRSVKFGFMIIMLLFLIPGLTWLSVRDYQANVQVHKQMTEESTEKLRGVSTYNELFSRLVLSAIYAPDPLNIFARRTTGVVQVPITFKTIPSIYEARESGNLSSFETVFWILDPLWVFLAMISLFGVVLGYDRISGEKENRCLPMMRLSTMSMKQVFWGKYVGLVIVLAISLFIGIAITLITVYLLISDVVNLNDWARIISIYFLLLFYGSIFLTIAMIVSTCVHESASSLATALLIWVCLITVVPFCANYSGKIIRSLPDRVQVRQILLDIDKDYRRGGNMELPQLPWLNKHNRTALLYIPESANFKVKRRLPLEWMDQLVVIYKDFIGTHNQIAQHELSAIWPFYEESMSRQARLVRWLERASPFGAASHIGNAIYRADAGAYLHFLNACRAYRQGMIEYLYGKISTDPYRVISPWSKQELQIETEYSAKLDRVGGRSSSNLPQIAGKREISNPAAASNMISAGGRDLVQSFLGDLPKYNYQAESLSNCTNRIVIDIVVLVLFHFVVFVIAFFMIQKYDPR